jgi:hypothetical protein
MAQVGLGIWSQKHETEPLGLGIRERHAVGFGFW